jgi:hypothetical protein
LIIFKGDQDTFVVFTELDYVQGPTGPPGSIDYSANLLYWTTPLPTTTKEAIDRIAKAMATLLGTKIPI